MHRVCASSLVPFVILACLKVPVVALHLEQTSYISTFEGLPLTINNLLVLPLYSVVTTEAFDWLLNGHHGILLISLLIGDN